MHNIKDFRDEIKQVPEYNSVATPEDDFDMHYTLAEAENGLLSQINYYIQVQRDRRARAAVMDDEKAQDELAAQLLGDSADDA